MTTTLEVLNHTGHMTMTWNHADEAERENALMAVESLKAQGYTFFLVDGTEGDADSAKGHLVVKKLTAAEVVKPPADEPAIDKKTKGKRGRRVVAARPMAGG